MRLRPCYRDCKRPDQKLMRARERRRAVRTIRMGGWDQNDLIDTLYPICLSK